MSATATGLTGRRFRRPPGTIIEPFRGCDDARAAEGFFGVVAVPGRSEPRLVDNDTALLLHALEEPGQLPTFALADLVRHEARDLIALIAEGLVEIELDGSFVTGTRVLRDLVCVGSPTSAPGRLNRTVLEHSLRLAGHGEASQLRDTLYFANTEPLSPDWRSRLAGGVESWLNLATCVAPSWEASTVESWTMFHRSRPQPGLVAGGWKLYLSPRAIELPAIIGTIGALFDETRAAQWKIGRKASGVLRPDKIVGYYPSRDALSTASAVFERELTGIAVHGLPFAVPCDDRGLVSWGVDPNRASATPVSWRYALCDLLAGWLASTDPADDVPVRVDDALRRARAEGFDPNSFEPPAIWLKEAEVVL